MESENVSPWEVSYEKYQEFPMVISPNIGCPTFLRVQENKAEPYHLLLNVIASKELRVDQIEEKLSNRLNIVPLFDLHKETNRLIRGNPISLNILNIYKSPGLTLGKTNLHDLYELKKKNESFLARHEFFGEHKAIYAVFVSFSIANQIDVNDWISTHDFLMFDLIQTFQKLAMEDLRTCFHSIVLQNKDGNSFQFCQISDLHIAKRFDELLTVMQETTPKLELDARITLKQLPKIERRYKNPNKYFRRFIRWVNNKTQQNKMDFVIITGDIIDYYLKNDFQRQKSYRLSESNWKIFLKILLNIPINYRADIPEMHINKNGEIQLPIFTITGNHDVRIFGYPITALKNYRKFGLTNLEALIYRDPFKTRKFRSLTIDRYSLRPYYQFINPFDDYFFQVGGNLFICFNSGGDSFTKVKGMLMGDPTSFGFSNHQKTFFKNTLNLKAEKLPSQRNIFLLTHAPLLNPFIKDPFKRKLVKFFKKGPIFIEERYKERNLKKIRKDDGRGNKFLNFDFGTLSKNQNAFISLMYYYKIMNLAGHSHKADEIRFKIDDDYTDLNKDSLKEIDEDAFIYYWDDYVHLPQYDMEFIRNNLPMVLQTPSLGIGRDWKTNRRGAFRIIKIEQNQIKNIKLKYLSKEKPW